MGVLHLSLLVLDFKWEMQDGKMYPPVLSELSPTK